jgi:ABC-type multidrug transport system fused ATPase/permease subunit
MATAVLRTVVGTRLVRRQDQVTYASSPLKRELSYWGGLLSSREAAPELRLFGLAEPLLARRRQVFDRYLAAMHAVRRQMAWQTLAGQALQEVVGWASIPVLLLLALQGAVSIGSLVGLLYGLSRFQAVTESIASGTAYLVFYWGFLGHLQDFLALAPEPFRGHGIAPPRPLRQGVLFHDVGFTYPGSDRPALVGITLALRPQERVALVGENGAGKTTLVRLLLGLYRPTHGTISVDGVALAEIDPDAWRREATAVFQDHMRYPTTVGENIAYGDVALLGDGVPTDGAGSLEPAHPRIAAAAAQSGADTFITGLPGGYATPLGKEFEGAVELSTGQWQRLAIARAYLRDAQIVVLDEPTAALDPRAEVEVYRQFSRAATGKCAVLISHRLGSARLADRIVVLSEGRIVEEGDHSTLLRQDGEYARMYRLQASWYGADEGRTTKDESSDVA